jgi:predicted nucleic acid-binding protein
MKRPLSIDLLLEKWWQVREKLMGLPMEVVAADLDMAEGAGRIKAAHKMSLPDCFAAALAILKKAEITPATLNSGQSKMK